MTLEPYERSQAHPRPRFENGSFFADLGVAPSIPRMTVSFESAARWRLIADCKAPVREGRLNEGSNARPGRICGRSAPCRLSRSVDQFRSVRRLFLEIHDLAGIRQLLRPC